MWFLRRAAAPEPPRVVVEIDGRPVPVELRRRAATRRLTLRVSAATGSVTLSLPDRVTLGQARAFLDAQADWLAARVARVVPRTAWAPGAVVPLRGVPHRIEHRPGLRSIVRADRDAGGASVLAVGGDAPGLPGRVERFLKSEAARDIRAAVALQTAALGVSARRITIRDTRSRWGSCSSGGALSFSWRLVMAPPLVLDYLAAHEVAHLRELNHSPRFWRLTRQLCPATDEAEAWLKRHGADLHRFG